MAFAKPSYSKGDINRAGEILAKESSTAEEYEWAHKVLANWRAVHGYPINTFQATLRKRLKTIDKNAIVAQRLKRTPSIIGKLRRFDKMKLARMQDIGGIRAVVGSIKKVRDLEHLYRTQHIQHELAHAKDYINEPKPDGYRGIHLIYKYKNDRAPEYDGLHVELQLRTQLQHAWATAVETMGTFLGQALKSGQGEQRWRSFFSVTSAALAHVEKSAPVPGYEGRSRGEIFAEVTTAEESLNILSKLRNFSIVADSILREKGQGSYHLIILDSSTKSVTIKPYPLSRLSQATEEYSAFERRAQAGEQIEAVLVSAGPIEALQRAYPNYFLDTHGFIGEVEKMIAESRAKKS